MKSSPTAITQPTRDCAANRSSLSNGVVQLTSRYKQILLPPLNFFFATQCFCVRLFLESAFKSIVTSPYTNCCFKSVWSYFISLKSTRLIFCSLPWQWNVAYVYLSTTDSFFLWGSQRKRLVYVNAIFVNVDVPMLYGLNLLTRFIPTKPMAVTQLSFSTNRWISFF